MNREKLDHEAAAFAADLSRLKPRDAPARADAIATLMVRGLRHADADSVIAHGLAVGWIVEVTVFGRPVVVEGPRARKAPP